jgi:CBS domain-containing protein
MRTMDTNEEDTLGAIMTRKPATIKPDASVRKALQLMIRQDVESLIVVKNGEPLGIVTERQLARLSSRFAKTLYERPVTRLMIRQLVTLPPSTPISDAIEVVLEKRIRSLPVVDQGHLVGIVTGRDLLKWVMRVFYEPKIPDRIKRLLA